MSETASEPGDHRLDLARELLDEHLSISGDVTRLGATTWAIHGVVPVDGEVIVAEFDTYDQARTALDQLSAERHPPAESERLAPGSG